MDLSSDFDTICAVATPVGEAGIGIVKISGPGALSIARAIFLPSSRSSSFLSHHLHHGWIQDPSTGNVIDEVLLSYMAAPNTYTRDDVVEINCHSGYMVLNRVLELVLSEGARLAAPGEFTRRAFLRGRLDLSQAEAVADIIHAQSQQSLAAANRILKGDLRNKLEAWRENILQLEAEVEAALDFSEETEDDVCVQSHSLIERLEQGLIAPVEELVAHYKCGRMLREGMTIVLTGKPNVGKSSLLNALVGKERAIVTPIAGTTRDVVEDSFIIAGVQVKILDTAGIRSKSDPIESIGMDRALRSVESADVALWIIDRSSPLSEDDDLVAEQVQKTQRVILLNKADLDAAISIEDVQERYGDAASILEISALDPLDVTGLRNFIQESFIRRPVEAFHSTIIPNLRHKESLEEALKALGFAKDLLAAAMATELVSFELQSARRYIDSILGWSAGEDLLDRVFSQFCIGK